MSREVGIVIDSDDFPIATVIGDHSHVDFPFELAWDYFKKYKTDLRLVHTHPIGATFLSEEDRTTLKAWAYTFWPYKVYMSVICPKEDSTLFINTWWYELIKTFPKNKSPIYAEKLQLFEGPFKKDFSWLSQILNLSLYE